MSDNNFGAARNVGTLTATTQTFTDWVGNTDINDYFRFALDGTRNLRLTLSGLGADADVQVLNNAGTVLYSGTNGGTTGEAINVDRLAAGTYYVRVFPGSTGAQTNYSLGLRAETPAALSIAALSADKNEGNSGTTPFTFKVTRSSGTGSSSVNWALAHGTTSAADFSGATSGTVSFAAGVTEQVITLNVVGDTAVENSESFSVNLGSAYGATIGTASAAGVIRNDDVTLPRLSIAALSADKNEGNSGTTPFTFKVTRSSGTGSSSVNWALAHGTTSAADFSGATSGTVSFAAGVTEQVITLNVVGDTAVENSESFSVNLGSASGATIGTASAAGLIRTDDSTSGDIPGNPVLVSSTPTHRQQGLARSTNIELTFNESVRAGSGVIYITNLTSGGQRSISVGSSQVSFSGNRMIINPETDLGSDGTEYQVTFGSGVVTDSVGNAFAGLRARDFQFITLGATPDSANVPVRLTGFPGGSGWANNSQGYNTTWSHGVDGTLYSDATAKWALDFGAGGATTLSAYAVSRGRVIAIANNGGIGIGGGMGLGNSVTIQYFVGGEDLNSQIVGGRDYFATYGHLADVRVTEDNLIDAGAPIGTIGRTGVYQNSANRTPQPIHLHVQFGTATRGTDNAGQQDSLKATGANDERSPVFFSNFIDANGMDDVPTNVSNGTRLRATDMFGSASSDRLFATSSGVRILGLAGNDELRGAGGDDELYGGRDNDTLNGGAGDDLLVGGVGNDVLTGGAGADTFRFVRLTDGIDTITDFSSAQADKIQVVAGNFGLAAGSVATVVGAFTGTSAQFRYAATNGQLWFDRDGTGTTHQAVHLATLSNRPVSLTSTDIQIVAG